MEALEEKLTKYLGDMLGVCDIEYRDSAIRYIKKTGDNFFVLQVSVQENNGYKYVALTNILLPVSMKRKGVSIAIITFLLEICSQYGYDLFVTGIVSDSWKEGLIRHGGKEDQVEDVYIDKQSWDFADDYNRIKFVEYENELILESELKSYSRKKNLCVKMVKDIFSSWNAEIDITECNGKVKQIIADKDNNTYLVNFEYPYINDMSELIESNLLENYIKENKTIGGVW